MECERKEGKQRSHRVSCFAIVLALVLFHATGVLAAPGMIVVPDDRGYPAFGYLAAMHNPKEILVDIWNLWSGNAGLPVEPQLMDMSGQPVVTAMPWGVMASGFAGLSGILVVAFVWNVSLRRRVQARTK